MTSSEHPKAINNEKEIPKPQKFVIKNPNPATKIISTNESRENEMDRYFEFSRQKRLELLQDNPNMGVRSREFFLFVIILLRKNNFFKN